MEDGSRTSPRWSHHDGNSCTTLSTVFGLAGGKHCQYWKKCRLFDRQRQSSSPSSVLGRNGKPGRRYGQGRISKHDGISCWNLLRNRPFDVARSQYIQFWNLLCLSVGHSPGVHVPELTKGSTGSFQPSSIALGPKRIHTNETKRNTHPCRSCKERGFLSTLCLRFYPGVAEYRKAAWKVLFDSQRARNFLGFGAERGLSD
mmetsp:Transcript_19229/g.41794  ORF Transcript_19229/g.41794 Transcript_19229/m.41794 type:complete len:201 (-) Transcript_19229:455-1057(-)